MKILFITANGIEDLPFGGVKGSLRNYKALQKFGEVSVYIIKKRSSLRSLISILQGFFPPVSKKNYREIKNMCKNNFDIVFYDGSIFGKLIGASKGVKSIVFYHNCEHDFINVRFGNRNSLKKKVYQRLIRKNEGYITKRADYRIAFSERDKKRIEKVYNIELNQVIPLGIEDKLVRSDFIKEEPSCLLLGSLCEANIEGYRWFVKKVSPFLICKTKIAGKGFQIYKNEWKSSKVSVIGYVEDLNNIYASASCVAIPVFSGAGMKVKTVEALMFGKTIFGTAEAFSGFKSDCGYLCSNAKEFIDKINEFISGNKSKFNEASRKMYEDYYSLESGEKKFEKMMKNLGAFSGYNNII